MFKELFGNRQFNIFHKNIKCLKYKNIKKSKYNLKYNYFIYLFYFLKVYFIIFILQLSEIVKKIENKGLNVLH